MKTGHRNISGKEVHALDIVIHKWNGTMIAVWSDEVQDFIYADYKNGYINKNCYMHIENNPSVMDLEVQNDTTNR